MEDEHRGGNRAQNEGRGGIRRRSVREVVYCENQQKDPGMGLRP